MNTRTPVLVLTLIASTASLAHAHQEPRSAVSLTISAGKPVGREAADSTIPVANDMGTPAGSVG